METTSIVCRTMDLFSDFCNICYKINDETLTDISEENIKDTLITFVGHADIINYNVLNLCQLCCEELYRFNKFKELCVSNLIQLRKKVFDMKSKLELEEDIFAVQNTLQIFVHEEVQRRNTFGKSNRPISVPAEYHEFEISSADLNKNDLTFSRQITNLKEKKIECQFTGDCSDVSVRNSATECDESEIALTHVEISMKRELLRGSEGTVSVKCEKDSDEYNEFTQNEIEMSASKDYALRNFGNDFDGQDNLNVGVRAVNNSEGIVNSGIESSIETVYVKEENCASQDSELETINGKFDNDVNVDFETVNVCSVVHEEYEDQSITNEENSSFDMKLHSGVSNNKSSTAIMDTQPSRPHGNGRRKKAVQSGAHERVYLGVAPHTVTPLCNESFKTNRPYKCSVCNKAFKQLSHLVEHERIHSGDRPYHCTVCNKAFKNSSSLFKHKRTHSSDRPYKCTVCNKAFAYSSTLADHVRIHSGDRPYKCTVCNKAYTQSSHLATHKRLHSGERPYNCTECNKSFADSSTLTIHKRMHSGDRPYKCTLCNKTYKQSSHLAVHKRSHSSDRP